MAEKIATRAAYGEALIELGAQNDKVVVLDADLANATQTGKFQKVYPDRHFNMGIAEANMVDVAAGMSTMGLIPFCSTFAMFGAGRAYEQVRNSIAYPRFNVKLCMTHAGVSVGAALTIAAAQLIVPALPYLLGFAAGAMLYVVAVELLPTAARGGALSAAVGFTVMMVLDVALG